MSESKLKFAWTDQGNAGLKYFKCGNCGREKFWKGNNHKIVKSHDIFKCPDCGKEFKFFWHGMEWKEV